MIKRSTKQNFSTTRAAAAAIAFCLMVTAPQLKAEGQLGIADSGHLQVNGNLLHYEQAGSGDVTLFVHGAISDRRVWNRYRDIISAQRRFVSYDQRHFGESIPTDKSAEFSPDAHTSDLIGFIEALDAGPVSVVSWSYGGDIVARAATQRPDLIKAMVFYEPDINGLITNLPGSARATDTLFANVGPAMAAVEKGDNKSAALHFIDLVFMMTSGSAAKEPADLKAIWQDNADTLPPYMEAPPGNLASCQKLNLVGQPTMVVGGSDGYTYDSMMVEQLVHCLPNAIRTTLQGATHDGPHSKPAEFAKMINSFLTLVVD